MTNIISSLGKSARVAAVAAVVGIVSTGSAMAQAATTCGEIGTTTSGIINDIYGSPTWKCDKPTNPNYDPTICALVTSLASCCAGASSTAAPSCICSLTDGLRTTLSGGGVTINCPPS